MTGAFARAQWSAQYYQAQFTGLQEKAGVALENIVYYRSSGAFAEAATHYFVMSTTADALHAFGAFKRLDDLGTETCAASNVDAAKLEAYARLAIGAFVPELAAHPLVAGQLNAFDFSQRRQSNRAVAVVAGAELGGGSMAQDSVCVVTRVGDALQEPFWPEGLGINRGFLGGLDCADLFVGALPLLLKPLGQPPACVGDFNGLVERREALYAITKRISGSNRDKELRPHLDPTRKLAYSIDPATRYATWGGAALGGLQQGVAGRRGPGTPRMNFHVK